MSAERIELERSLAEQCAIRGTMISNAIIELYNGNLHGVDLAELEALHSWIEVELRERDHNPPPFSNEPF